MPVHPRRNDIVDIGTKRRRLEKLSERGVGHGFERPDLDLGGDRLLTGEIGRVEPCLPQLLQPFVGRPAEPTLRPTPRNGQELPGLDTVRPPWSGGF